MTTTPSFRRRLTRPVPQTAALVGAAMIIITAPVSRAIAAERVAYPMSAAGWTMELTPGWAGSAGTAKFARYEGMPLGTMTLNEGVASSRTASFATGTIDFDMKPNGYSDAGIIFHRAGEREGEFFYLRANPDCPAADDCIQYAPITKTLMAWNIYYNYQRPANISQSGWNHVHLVVSGDSMLVYLNRAHDPSLVVPQLRGLTRTGGIAFKGPATYANLVLSSAVPSDLPRITPPEVEKGAIRTWLAAPPTAYDRSRALTMRDAPPPASWKPIDVEPTGLVNLGRAFGIARSPSVSIAWLKADVEAASAEQKILQLGYAEQLWVFLNGEMFFKGNNTYYPAESRISPDGRLEPDNASVSLNIRRGRNEIILAVSNDWRPDHVEPKVPKYGWGVEAHLTRANGQ